MKHSIEFTPTVEKTLRKIKKKDIVLFERVTKKIEEILDNPERYKPLKNVLKGTRRAHLDPFVIIFSIEKEVVTFHHVKHHDKAYSK